MSESLEIPSEQAVPAPQPQGEPGFFEVLANLPEKVWVALALLGIGVIAYYYCLAIDNEILGFTHDDGVYAITGQSLALGKGFTLLHEVSHPPEIKYPFAYPFLLSLVWKVQPHFPANLLALNYLTIVFTLGACWLIYAYLRYYQNFPGWLSILVMALTTSNFFFMYFFSTVMSEAPYLFFTLLVLFIFSRQHSRYPDGMPAASVVLLGVLSAIAFLTRVPGITLMAAIGTWFLLNRQWKRAILYGTVSFLLGVLPWVLWCKLQTPKLTDLNYPILNAYSNYTLEFWHNVRSGNYFTGLGKDFESLLDRLLEDMFPLISNFLKIYPQYDSPQNRYTVFLVGKVCSVLLFGWFLIQAVSAVRKSFRNDKFIPGFLTVPGLYVFYYLVIITFWNYEDQMARFLTVILPLLWMFFFKPLLAQLPALTDRVRVAAPAMAARAKIALAVMLLLALLSEWPTANSYKIVYKSRSQHWVESGKMKWLWGEYKTAFAWINGHLPKDAPLGASSDAVFYLYTGHPTMYIFYASLHRARGRFTPESIPLLMQSMDHYGIRYLVAEPHMQFRTVLLPMNAVAKSLLDTYPERFEHIYASPHSAIHIFKILPPKKTEDSTSKASD